MSQEPPTCIGCGKDHARGEGCGYSREVIWTPYTKAEKWKHIKLYPPILGIACVAGLVWLSDRGASQTGDFMYFSGMILLALFALFLGGVGTWDLIRELRRHRWRAASKDGKDRALIVMSGGKVSYGFGESLIYRPMNDLAWAEPLSSSIDALDLREALHEGFRELLRASLANRDLYRDDEDRLEGPMEERENEALVFAATLLGMAARGEVELYEGRFKGWGRGRAKMKQVTEGYDLAITRGTSEPDGAFETKILAAVAEGSEPTSIAEMSELRDDGTEESRDEALDGWEDGLKLDPELIQQLLETRLSATK